MDNYYYSVYYYYWLDNTKHCLLSEQQHANGALVASLRRASGEASKNK
jgi:hypothetical protein